MTSPVKHVAIDGQRSYPHAEQGATIAEVDSEPQPEDQLIAGAADDGSDEKTLDELGAEIRSTVYTAKRASQSAVVFAIRAGQLLLKARPRVPKGKWGAWLAANCQFSERTALEYMQVAQAFNEGRVDVRRAADSLRNVLCQLRNENARDSAADNRKGRPAFLSWDQSRRRFLELTRELHEHPPTDLTPQVFSQVVRDTIAALQELLQ